MRRQELSAAARRRGDQIRVSRIAALLSALIVLTAVHRTQAQHAPDASWINPRASAPHPSEVRRRKVGRGQTWIVKLQRSSAPKLMPRDVRYRNQDRHRVEVVGSPGLTGTVKKSR